jgi:hypothetical protein
MSSLHPALEMALDRNDFDLFNTLLQIPSIRDTASEYDNHALKLMIKKGVLSSVKELMKINEVWLTFYTDEVVHLANVYSNHPGIARFIMKTAYERFMHFLQYAENQGDLTTLLAEFQSSKFLRQNAAQNNNLMLKMAIMQGSLVLVKEVLKETHVADALGVNELFIALKYSNHVGIVRELLKNEGLVALVGDEMEVLEGALYNEDYSFVTDELECLAGIDEKRALDTAPEEDLEEQSELDEDDQIEIELEEWSNGELEAQSEEEQSEEELDSQSEEEQSEEELEAEADEVLSVAVTEPENWDDMVFPWDKESMPDLEKGEATARDSDSEAEVPANPNRYNLFSPRILRRHDAATQVNDEFQKMGF